MLVQLDGNSFYIETFQSFLLLRPKEHNTTLLSQLAIQILDANLPFITNVISTEKEICIQFEGNSVDTFVNKLGQVKFQKIRPEKNQFILPVYFYETEDVKHIEQVSNLSFDKYIDKLLTSKYQISMYGFLPGFLYMRGLEDGLSVPRKSTPAKHIEAGSIAVGGNFLGLYSLATPAGWNVIGKTPIQVLDLPQTPPMLIAPGDEIKLKQIDKDEFKVLEILAQNIIEYND